MLKKDVWLIAIALVIALGVAGFVWVQSAVPTGSWGLSFREPGQPPVGMAGVDQLAQLNALYLGDPLDSKIYLTFDAGYENGSTEQILNTLQEKDVEAMFFLDGNYIRQNADLVRRMAADGHTVGNHTMHHPDMSKLEGEEFKQELRDLEDLYRQTTGQEIGKFYRPPQGCYSEENLRQAKALGYKTVFWSLAHVDWNRDAQPDPEEAIEKLTNRIHPGAVVLFHANSQTNAQILGELIDKWRELGYEFGVLQ